MSLVDEARARERSSGNPCGMQRLKSADPKLYAETIDAIKQRISCRAISEALRDEHDVAISPQVIENHRNNACAGCRQ